MSEKEKKEMGVLNGGFAADLYSRIPCRVGYKYMRVNVDGNVNPCCIMGTSLGSILDKTFHEVWFSDPYSVFREKMNTIHQERFHLTDPEWTFCQQCPHSDQNLESFYEAEVGKNPLGKDQSELIQEVLKRTQSP